MDQHRRTLAAGGRPSAGRRRRSSSRACRRCRGGRAAGSSRAGPSSSTPPPARPPPRPRHRARAARTWCGSASRRTAGPRRTGPSRPAGSRSRRAPRRARSWTGPGGSRSPGRASRGRAGWPRRAASGPVRVSAIPGTRSAFSQARENESPEGGSRSANETPIEVRRGYTHAAHYWEGVSHRGVGGVRQGPAGLAAPRRRLSPATARQDHVGHQVRPDRRPGRVPVPHAAPLEPRRVVRRAAEPGLRLPVPARTVLPAR